MGVGKIGVPGPGVGSPAERAGSPGEVQKSFKDLLFESIEKVDRLQVEAEAAMSRVHASGTDPVTEALAAAQKSELAFRTLMQIRDRIMAAYQEINDMRFS